MCIRDRLKITPLDLFLMETAKIYFHTIAVTFAFLSILYHAHFFFARTVMPRSTMIFPIVLLCIGVDLLSFIGSLSNEICHFPRFFRGQRHQLAAYLFALEIISHIMTQCSKSRKALTVLHLSLIHISVWDCLPVAKPTIGGLKER